MRVLIVGGNGQLGRDVTSQCAADGDEVLSLGKRDLDITDQRVVSETVARARPDVVINCAAWTAVDDAELHPEQADLVNHRAVAFLAAAAAGADAHLVHLSTDYVFDGTKTTPYTEVDAPNPQCVYGRSKLRGEHAAGPNATVVRTSWVFSRHGGNMVATIARLARTQPELRFVDDQVGNPTFTADLAVALRQLARDRHCGTLHVTNQGTVSWFMFAQEVMSALGLDPNRVSPVASADLLPAPLAPRPAQSALSNDLFTSLGYSPMRDFRDALNDCVSAYL